MRARRFVSRLVIFSCRLHTEDLGLPGQGGLPYAIVEALFKRYDKDGSGELDYEEFSGLINKPLKQSKMF